MRLQNVEELKAALKMLKKSDAETFNLYGLEVERIEILIAIFIAIKKFKYPVFGHLPYRSVVSDEVFQQYTYQIRKYELCFDRLESCGFIPGKFLTIEQAWLKLKSLETQNGVYSFRIEGVKK